MATASTSRTLIVDNGAHSIKTLWADSADTTPTIFRNAVVRSKTTKRNYIADELDSECLDYGGLVFRLAFDRGILNNWEVEKTIWDKVWSNKGSGLNLDPSETSLLITEPVMNLPNVQEHYDQMLFEEYDFGAVFRCPGPSLVPFGPDANTPGDFQPECVLVVDSGFSFTHIVPVLRGAVISSAVRRIDIGGKLLTNHLKELVSFRQWYMMDQTSVIERAKEECCYVTNEWEQDWEKASISSRDTSIVRTYVLPDFVPTSSNKLGYVRNPNDPADNGKGKGRAEDQDMNSDSPMPLAAHAPAEEEQLLQMNNERFAVPELLFSPSTIGLNQMGIPEAITSSIASLPEELRGLFWANIVCVGGNTGFPGFHERLRKDLRPIAPDEFDVVVRSSSSPTNATVLSGPSAIQNSPRLARGANFLTRQEYQEGGSNAARRKFGGCYLTDSLVEMEMG